ncbi:hypothetical protein P8452_12560 [Trifolium repens]|nr:hypothetical protein P8452_12560 [Trifolium repens]
MHIPILTNLLVFTILLTRSLLPLPHYYFTLHNRESLHSSYQIPFHTFSKNRFLLGLSAYLNVGDCDFVVVFVLFCKAVGETGFTPIVIAKRVGENLSIVVDIQVDSKFVPVCKAAFGSLLEKL